MHLKCIFSIIPANFLASEISHYMSFFYISFISLFPVPPSSWRPQLLSSLQPYTIKIVSPFTVIMTAIIATHSRALEKSRLHGHSRRSYYGN